MNEENGWVMRDPELNADAIGGWDPTRTNHGFRTVVGPDGPDGPISIYDLDQPEEPCVFTAVNAEEADAWCADNGPGRPVNGREA